MKLIPNSIAGRLALSAITMITIALIVAALGIGFALERFIRGQIDQRLDAQITNIASAITMDAGTLKLTTNVDAPPFERRSAGWYWQVIFGEQNLRSSSLAGANLNIPLHRKNRYTIQDNRPQSSDGHGPNRQDLHFRTKIIFINTQAATVVATAPQSALLGPTIEALWPMGVSLALLGLCLGVATIVQVRVGLRPLKALKSELEDVRNGRAMHIPADQPEELKPLVGELNSLIDQNNEGLTRARSHVANLGHALNTPLATLELMLRDDSKRGRDSIALVREMQERIRHHLGRARTSVLNGPTRARSPIAPRINDLVAVLSKIYVDKNIAFKNLVSNDLAVACEPQDLDEMLGNILDNAFKWAKTKVKIKSSMTGKNVALTLEDDGLGLTDDNLPVALMPGRRLDENTPGTGFGLSITRELAELYGGNIVLSRGELGGLKVVLILPTQIDS